MAEGIAKLFKERTALNILSELKEIFEKQSEEYRESVLPRKMKARVSVEAGLTFGWERMIGTYGVAVGMTTFGTSGPAGVLFKHFGITPEGVVAAAKQSMQNVKDFQ